MPHIIDITGVNLTDLLVNAFAITVGNGPERLAPEDAQELVDQFDLNPMKALDIGVVDLFEVHLTVYRAGSQIYLNDTWPEHTHEQLAALLKLHGLNLAT